MAQNVLFIMCDQLRWDYLSCAGHPTLQTPHIDALAKRGVRFDRAYVQSTICGPSRMSFYTGRYVSSHGSTWNGIPLKVGEMTLGDHLRPLGVRTALCGKTHMTADVDGMRRLGLAPDSQIGALVSECGFEPFERDDGLHPSTAYGKRNAAYDQYMKDQGWDDDNPWESVANSGEDADGNILSGWFLDNSDLKARAPDEDSETPYTTRRAMDFIREAGDTPWCLHLSYIKPHWPYIVPSPYHDMYPANQHLPVLRDPAEKTDPHPVFGAYMGLIKQIDDQMGELMAFLDAQGLNDSTMIVFTSDHGDYLGDHWLGEKELFHDASARIPLIVVDPSDAADTTRGTVSDALVEAIDVVPTILDYFGGPKVDHILEGHSLLPLMRGATDEVRDYVISEYDYSFRQARRRLGLEVKDAKLTMLFDGRWKYIFAETFCPMLFDLQTDPDELVDLGGRPDHAADCSCLNGLLFQWSRRISQRTTMSDAEIEARGADLREAKAGIIIGFPTEADLKEALDGAKKEPDG